MPIETRANVLAWFVWHSAHVWKAIIGVSHDCEAKDTSSAYLSAANNTKRTNDETHYQSTNSPSEHRILVEVASCAAYDDAAVWPGNQVVVFVVGEAHHVAFGQFGCACWYESRDHAFDGDDLALHFWDECGSIAVGRVDDIVALY